MKYLNLLKKLTIKIFLLGIVCVLFSCQEDKIELNGEYGIMGVTTTLEGAEKNQSFKELSTLQFKEYQLKVNPDLWYGIFKDSVYDYSITDNELKLKGNHGTLKFKFDGDERAFDIYPEHQYFEKLSFLPKDK